METESLIQELTDNTTSLVVLWLFVMLALVFLASINRIGDYMTGELNFPDLEPRREPVSIGTTRYVLQEASEDTATKFQSLAIKGAVMEDGKVRLGGGLGDMEPFLVSRCLWELNDKGEPFRQVPEQIVRQWPSRIVKPIFDRCKEISGLSIEESPERKALLAALTTGRDVWLQLQPGDHVVGCGLDQFRVWAKALVEQDPKLYGPLWKLVEPKEGQGTEAKNS